MTSSIRLLPALSACIFASTVAHAQSAGAHVHGEAELAIVAQDGEISISLMSAMYNVVGFERAPKTNAEREAVNSARMALENGSDLFVFAQSAACKLISAQHGIPEPEAESEDHAHSSEQDHHDHEPDEHHHSHSDLEASFAFACGAPENLKSVEIHLFDHFKNLEKVNVIALSGDQQEATTLSPERRRVRLPVS